MNKKLVIIGTIIIAALGIYWALQYFGVTTNSPLLTNEPIVIDDFEYATHSASVAEVPYTIEPFVNNLEIPWSMIFTDENRMLVTERPGRIRQITNGILDETPLYTFSNISSESEEGLMGLELDPEYGENKYVYVSYAYPRRNEIFVRVSRFVDQGDQFTGEKILIDQIPAAKFHAGSQIKFGPDNKLYITTGDASQRQLAQDLDSLAGKILRINKDGTIPDDNPFPDSPVWSYGHRNPQGIDWHAPSGVMYQTEHGPSIFDGPAGGDEVNVIEKGQNYGWPIVSHEESREGMVDPMIVFTPAVAPGSGHFYSSNKIPQFTNNFFFGGLGGETIVRVIVSESNPENVVAYEKLPNINYGRIRAITEGPDGALYFATSNRDGRGDPRAGDDTIYRIAPVTQ